MTLESSIRLDPETKNGVVNLYRGAKHILQAERRPGDKCYQGFESQAGIVTVGAGTCSSDKQPKCQQFVDSTTEYAKRLTQLGVAETMIKEILLRLDR